MVESKKDGGCLGAIFAIMAHPLFQIICASITVGLAIYAMLEANKAYTKMKDVSSDIERVVDNWEMSPITAIAAVPRDSACPSDHEEVSFANWPGSGSQGSCACPYDNVNGVHPSYWIKTERCRNTKTGNYCSGGRRARDLNNQNDYGYGDDENLQGRGLGSGDNQEDKGYCECVMQHTKMTISGSSKTACDSSDLKAGCISERGIPKVEISSWRGSKICIQRDSEPTATYGDEYSQRPVPDSEGSCGAGYKVCNGLAAKGYRTCQPTSKTCPIVHVLKVGSAETNGYTKVTFADGQFLQVSTEGNSSLPLVRFESYVAQPGRDDGGRCYSNSPSRAGYASSSDIVSYKNSMPSNCGTGNGKQDTRYLKLDEYETSDWLTEEFQLTSVCTGKWGIAGTGTDTRDNSQTCTGEAKGSAGAGSAVKTDPDCALQGVDLSRTTRSNCLSEGKSTTNCDAPEYSVNLKNDGCKSNDDLCKGILFQTKCGQYARFAAKATGSFFGLYREEQIKWDTECSADYEEMENSEDILEHVVRVLHTNLVFSILGSIVTGIILPLLIIGHNISALYEGKDRGDLPCIPGDGALEAQIIDVCSACIGPVFTICKVCTSAFAYVAVKRIKGVFEALKDEPCSDEVTNYTTGWLGSALPDVYSSIEANFATEAVMFLYVIYHIVSIIMKCCNGTFGKSPDELERMSNERNPL